MQRENDIIPHQDLVEQVIDERIEKNGAGVLTGSVQTIDDTPTDIDLGLIPDGEAWAVSGIVIASQVDTLDVSAGGAVDVTVLSNIDDNPRIVDDEGISLNGGPSWSAEFSIVEEHLILAVTGEVGAIINWAVKLSAIKVSVL